MSHQVTGNVGMYFAAYQLSRHGWNVMPTARNARGIDLLAYDANADKYLGIQVKTLSKASAIPLGIKPLANLLGDWWIIISKVEQPGMLHHEARRSAKASCSGQEWTLCLLAATQSIRRWKIP